MKRFVLFFVLLHFLLCLSAQQEVYFNKRIDHYNNYDYSRNIIVMDSGYMVGGFTEDANYVNNIHLSFTKLNMNGDIISFKEYGYDSINMFLGNPGSLIQYSDNKYYTVGTKRLYTTDWVYDQGMLACYNSSFDTLWTQFFGEKTMPYDTAFLLYQIKKIENGNLIMTGIRLPKLTPSSLWVMETDSMGNKLWETFIGGEDEYYYQGHSIVQTNDGGYAIGGFMFKIGSISRGDPLILKTDSLGNEQWRINPGNPDVDDNKVMLTTDDDGNIIAGTNYGTQESGDNQWMVVKIMKVTPEGEIIWDFNYGVPGYDKFLLNTIVLQNGSIITNGVITLFGDDDPWETSWILCVDSLGNQLWYKEYALLEGKNSFNDLFDVKQTFDNGLIGCGVVMPGLPYDTGTVDIWVMKMDSVGCLEAGCDTIVGLAEINKNPMHGFRVFPNPASSELTIALEKESSSNSDVNIVNIYGIKTNKITIPAGSKMEKIDISSLKPGVYFATFNNGKKVISVKFVVSR